ncbi:hypothetical protein PVT01_030027200 [Plasmodium vivax]|uniref:VIR protein n=1 Tax=Plasmodium vivax TaxID=5855 RepID=A0A1G4GSA4_PLAVI|nr:hypothetical protein PVT01_030027200 [Plasmodium vivax]
MDKFSMDIDEWKAKYPFLKNEWASFEEFERSVGENDDPFGFSESTCKLIIMRTDYNTREYLDFCKKLTRNLGAYTTDKKIINSNSERCKNINSWLNYLIRKYNISNEFIQKCFDNSKLLEGVHVKKNMCTYYPYEKVINEEDMLKITIFVDNIFTIQNILQNEEDNYNCLGRKFLYECFNIYQNINNDYCSEGKNRDNTNICSKLSEFKSHYDTYISTLSNILEGIQFKDDCPLNERKTESLPDQVNKTGSSGPSSATTALSTVAGVSSALALLYKITPAERWINFGLRGGRRGINNNLYGGEGNEMLFDGNVHSEFNSYNIGYEAA